MAYLKLMMDEKEIAHLSEDGQSLCANEGVPQYYLPLNLFIGDKREVPLVDVVVWAKKRIFPKNRMDCKEILKRMGLPDYNAWEIVKRTNACLMEDPYWLRFSEDETFEDTTRGRARRIMNEIQNEIVPGIRDGEIFLEDLVEALVLTVFGRGVHLEKVPE